MGMSQIKDFTQKLKFLKDYSSLLLPIIIGLLAVILFVPTQLMSSRLKEQIEKQSVSGSGRSIKNLRDKAVSSKQWEIEKFFQLSHASDANKISLWARQSTQRSLLSYRIFPEAKDKSRFVFDEFGNNFCDSIDSLLSKVRGNDRPTTAEIEIQLKKLSSTKSISRSRRRGFQSQNKVEDSIVEAVCLERARAASFYVSNYELAGYEFWKDYDYIGVDEGVIDSWYWQIAYWIIEDVLNSISSANAYSSNVLDAPIKRLLELNFTDVSSTKQRGSRSRSRAGSETKQSAPAYVLTEDDGLAETFTNRITNDEIDVVHFHISVLISNKGVLGFMDQLCSAKSHSFAGFKGTEKPAIYKHNQITILESNLESIDIDAEEHQLYRYGTDEALLKMNLYCEYIFDKQAYDEIKPEAIKEQMKEEDDDKDGRRRR